ncbi:hypothetical protein [Poritiphilus flavus]|uniref:Glycerophosphoryl diester phosphodiesterase n=1 Tax=Poritiphilus flavus TaxID=2697053 RepID=A0A6L9E8E7_9FLAO|nr:hypothetical protein [Poritiphilus flavus]NAS10986.1 hypothetical protein [Poritiphilus flavus]
MFPKARIPSIANGTPWKGPGIKMILPLMLCFLCITAVSAKDAVDQPKEISNPKNATAINDGHILLNSYSFNAKKRSSFTINGVSEQINRGLTVIHFQTSNTYEFKTFDTYGSEESAAEFLKILKALVNGKGTYMILAHDSASKSLQKFSGEIGAMGFKTLSQLVNRQAYTAHNFGGKISEKVHDISIHLDLAIPARLDDKTIYFPKPSWDFEPSTDRYIAHAAGEVNGVKSTNSREALDENYKKGFRLFELDIIETSDGKYVAAHDWKMWARFTDYSGSLPVSHAEFLKHKIYGKYTTLDMKRINQWFAAHPDAILITDKVDDPIRFADQFQFRDRLIMELFSPLAIEEAAENNITSMISQEPLARLSGDKMAYLAINKVKYVAVSRRIIPSQTDFLLKLKENGLKVYVYNVNFDPGKDEKYVFENELGLVYGMYADKWVFDEPEN